MWKLLPVFILVTAGWSQDLGLVFQWPAGREPVMDGNIEEWKIVPEVYTIRQEDTEELQYNIPTIDKADYDLIGWVAFAPSTNHLIIASSVFDDYHERDNTDKDECYCYEDDIEFSFDADHAGDPYVAAYGQGEGVDEETQKRALNAGMQWWAISVPPVGGEITVSRNFGHWQEDPPYHYSGYAFEGEEQGEGTYFYEMSLTGWDDLDWHGADKSIVHTLKENEVIGLTLSWTDYDGPLSTHFRADGQTAYDAYWTAKPRSWLLAPVEAGLFPTAVENETWGRLKARFQ